MNITKNKVEFTHSVVDQNGMPSIIDSTTRLLIATVDNEGGTDEENDANGSVMADALNVAIETGLTPTELIAHNLHLRRLLASAYSGAKLYGDDGEIQDNTERPYIDYVRMTPEQIEAAFHERAKAKIAVARNETE